MLRSNSDQSGATTRRVTVCDMQFESLVDGPRAIALRNRGDSHSAQKWQRNPHHMTTH